MTPDEMIVALARPRRHWLASTKFLGLVFVALLLGVAAFVVPSVVFSPLSIAVTSIYAAYCAGNVTASALAPKPPEGQP